MITNVKALEILDSRGIPTIEVELELDNQFIGCAKVPSGTSTGKYEALEIRDTLSKNYLGKGVASCVNKINTSIKKQLLNKEFNSAVELDQYLIHLDGTKNKSKLGANTILAISLSFVDALSKKQGCPIYKYIGGENATYLPVPMMNLINGGTHANNEIDFQEYMLVPYGFKTFKDALRASAEVFQTLQKHLKELNHITSVGLEGGFAPNCIDNEEPLNLLIEAIEKAGYKPYKHFGISLDVAASELYDKEEKIYKINKRKYTSDELIEYYEYLVETYPILSIEDGLDETDYEGWKKLTDKLKDKTILVGDDLFVTNKELLSFGINEKIANSILIKLNQIGSFSETIETINLAKDHNYTPIISHRSGETEDTFIADLSVGISSPLIKSGSLSRSERTAKYNRLLKIEDSLSNPIYQGENKIFDNIKKRG